MKSPNSNIFFQLIRWSTIAVFLGRAWQHIFWDAPYRAFLWDQALLGNFVESWGGIAWEDYVSSPVVDDRIQMLIVTTGFFYLICAGLAFFANRLNRIGQGFLLSGAFCLMLLAGLYWKEKFHHPAQFLEYSLQFGSPVFLWVYVRQKVSESKLILWMKWACALTFFSHGLYAIGYYPRPENFTSMTMACLGINEAFANGILDWAGRVDFVVALLLIVPGRWAYPALVYCMIWGFLTALARPWANFYPAFWVESLHQWVYQFVYRFPHFLIPAAIFIWLRFRPSVTIPR